MISLSPEQRDRFWSKVRMSDGCWEWQGFTHKGYGRFTLSSRRLRAHRVAYALYYGSIPEGLEIDHICNNKRCVNPLHLQAATHQENSGRAANRKVWCKRGHLLSGDNVYVDPRGRRSCRQCKSDWYRERKLEQQEAV